MSDLRAPFPWMGGKSRCADEVWRALGPDIVNYVEPFAGSLAALLSRPNGPGKIETCNDLSGAICNFWRAIATDPDAVAEHCDWPVSELDLHARHAWLVDRLEVMAEELRADPHYFDAKVAGWWVWGICQWIGTGWCGGIKRVLSRQLPDIRIHNESFATGAGVLASGLLAKSGLPAIGNDRGINGASAPPCLEWFRALQARLRRVRVVCGDWTRVLGPSVLGKGKNVGGRRPCGVFLDPPYDVTLRAKRIYTHDEAGVAAAARDWAIKNGDDPDLRIVLAGYYDEHAPHMPKNWTVYRWKGARGYAGEDNDNREQETLFCSPHCISLEPKQVALFA